MRLLVLCCIAIFSQLSYAAEPIWTKDSTNGCLVFNESPQPNETVTWSGSCVGGKADGVGVLVWFRDGITKQTIPTTGENGLTMVAGDLSGKVLPRDVSFKLNQCDKSVNYRSVDAYVRNDFALWERGIATSILNMAVDFAQANCPCNRPRDNVDIRVYYEGDSSKKYSLIEARSAIDVKGVFRFDWYSHSAANDFLVLPRFNGYLIKSDNAPGGRQCRFAENTVRNINRKQSILFSKLIFHQPRLPRT